MYDFDSIPNLRRTFSPRSQLLEGIAQRVLRLAQNFAPNTHVREAISVEEIGDNASGNVSIILKADRNKAPDARAYEHGSGTRAQRSEVSPKQQGSKGTITIEAKNFPFLFFIGHDGRKVFIKKVNHPGVEAANNGQGYLRKAVKEANKQNREDVRKEGAAAIKLDLKERFGRIGKR